MRAGEKPIESWCSECQEMHWSTVLGGKIEISTSTDLIKAKFCIGCDNPTTGSIGQAGYFWQNVCQTCKEEADSHFCRVTKEVATSVEYILEQMVPQ